MKFSRKDTAATISMLLVVVFTIALMMGAFNNIDAKWALATFVIFLVGGATGLVTGTATMMQNTWSSISLLVLSVAALVITIVNAFLNSEAWMVAMTVTYVLMWAEYVGLDLFSHSKQGRGGVPTGGAV